MSAHRDARSAVTEALVAIDQMADSAKVTEATLEVTRGQLATANGKVAGLKADLEVAQEESDMARRALTRIVAEGPARGRTLPADMYRVTAAIRRDPLDMMTSYRVSVAPKRTLCFDMILSDAILQSRDGGARVSEFAFVESMRAVDRMLPQLRSDMMAALRSGLEEALRRG